MGCKKWSNQSRLKSYKQHNGLKQQAKATEQEDKITIKILVRSGPLTHQGKTTEGQKPKLIQPATANNTYIATYNNR